MGTAPYESESLIVWWSASPTIVLIVVYDLKLSLRPTRLEWLLGVKKKKKKKKKKIKLNSKLKIEMDVEVLKELSQSGQIEDSAAFAQKHNQDHQAVVGVLKSLEMENYVSLSLQESKQVGLSQEAKGYIEKGTPEFQLYNFLPADGSSVSKQQVEVIQIKSKKKISKIQKIFFFFFFFFFFQNAKSKIQKQ